VLKLEADPKPLSAATSVIEIPFGRKFLALTYDPDSALQDRH
jgi:hypothetical protein